MRLHCLVCSEVTDNPRIDDEEAATELARIASEIQSNLIEHSRSQHSERAANGKHARLTATVLSALLFESYLSPLVLHQRQVLISERSVLSSAA